MTDTRIEHPAATEAEVDEAPLADDMPAAEMTARAARMRQQADCRLERAGREQAALSERTAPRRAEIARLVAEIEADERETGTLTGDLQHQAHDGKARARWLDTAADFQARAAEADTRAAELEAERRHLAEEILAEVGSLLTRFLAEREDIAAKLADAQAETDIDLAGKLGVRLTALEGTLATLEGRQRDAQDRLAVIGDGEGPGLLTEARQEAAGLHGHAHRALNDVDPDRREARRDREMAEREATVAALVGYFAAEEAPPGPVRVTRS